MIRRAEERRDLIRPRSRVAIDGTGDEPGAGGRVVGLGGGRRQGQKFRCQSRGRSRATSCPRPPRRSRPRQARPPRIPRPPKPSARAPPAPALAPATRQHAALPPPARKPPSRRPRSPRRHRPRRPTRTRWRTSSSWSASTSRRTRPGRSGDHRIRSRANSPNGSILRSDDNGASVERYRAFMSANPSWPSQTFLRRRARSGAVGRPSRRRHGLGVVRKRIAALGQGHVLAGAGDARARRPRQCASAWCARPGATIRCPRTPKPRRWICSARC